MLQKKYYFKKACSMPLHYFKFLLLLRKRKKINKEVSLLRNKCLMLNYNNSNNNN